MFVAVQHYNNTLLASNFDSKNNNDFDSVLASYVVT